MSTGTDNRTMCIRDADEVLREMSAAQTEGELRRLRDELLLDHAAPVIRQVLRRRVWLRPGYDIDRDDLFNEVILRLMNYLGRMREQPDAAAIRNFGGYVARVTTNTCNDELRRRSQGRHLLRNRLRSLLERHRDFVAYREAGLTFCGLAQRDAFRPGDLPSLGEDEISAITDRLRALPKQGAGKLPLSAIARAALALAGHAIELDDLTAIIGAFLLKQLTLT